MTVWGISEDCEGKSKWKCQEKSWCFIHTGRTALSLAALEGGHCVCGSARAEGLEKKAENSSNPTDQGLCFCNARPALFHAELRWQEVALVCSLCLRNLTPVYNTESAFKGNRFWQKSASVFPCGVLSIIQCPGHHKHSWPIPVLQRAVLAFILCTCQCWYTSPGEPGLGIRSFPVVGDALETPSMEPSQGGSSPEVLLHSVLPRSVISAGVSE